MSRNTSNSSDESSAQAEPRTISAEQFREERESNPSISVVDVRTHAEFVEVRLEGVELIPIDELDGMSLATRYSEDSLYLMCGSGKRAMRAAEQLCAAGHNDVIVVEGGMQSCEAAGMDVVKGS